MTGAADQPPPPGTRVARRRAATRRRLLAAARSEIARNGVDGLRLRDVIDAAGVGFGSLYSHFDDRQAVVEAVFTDTVENVARATIAVAAEEPDPARAVAVAQQGFVGLAFEEPEIARLIVRLDHADALFADVTAGLSRPILERGVAEGRFTIDDVDAMLTFMVGGTLATVRAILTDRLPPTARVSAARILLQALGLSARDAAEVAARPLPPIAVERDD
ncbi:MAG: TetR/AcrR family transcriptional regulator [Solirubrobacteraceae bacterium]|nr:TetR/AcrR family transcriptional regulator [Solirubrobacteraceae bacterium]